MRRRLVGRLEPSDLEPSEETTTLRVASHKSRLVACYAGLLIKVVGQQALGQELMLGVSPYYRLTVYILAE